MGLEGCKAEASYGTVIVESVPKARADTVLTTASEVLPKKTNQEARTARFQSL